MDQSISQHCDITLNHANCMHYPLQDGSFCAILNECGLQDFAVDATIKDFNDGQVIFSQGKNNEYLGSVITGMVKIYKLLDNGQQQIVSLAFAGDMLGNVIDDDVVYYASAIGNAKLCFYQISRINGLAESNPQIYHVILEKTNQQLTKAREWLMLLGRKTAEEKIATFILLLSAHHQLNDASLTFKLPLKRYEIANFLGLTIETVSRKFSNLKNQQIIREQAGHILTIVDYDLLQKIA